MDKKKKKLLDDLIAKHQGPDSKHCCPVMDLADELLSLGHDKRGGPIGIGFPVVFRLNADENQPFMGPSSKPEIRLPDLSFIVSFCPFCGHDYQLKPEASREPGEPTADGSTAEPIEPTSDSLADEETRLADLVWKKSEEIAEALGVPGKHLSGSATQPASSASLTGASASLPVHVDNYRAWRWGDGFYRQAELVKRADGRLLLVGLEPDEAAGDLLWSGDSMEDFPHDEWILSHLPDPEVSK